MALQLATTVSKSDVMKSKTLGNNLISTAYLVDWERRPRCKLGAYQIQKIDVSIQ